MQNAVSIVDEIICEAYKGNASDIHIDAFENCVNISLRVDGILSKYREAPRSAHQEIISRLKILSQLRTDEHSLPQDGRFKIDIEKHIPLDIRISIVTAYYGESAVLRLLKDTSSTPRLNDLGMCKDDEQEVMKMLGKASGMIIATGPTGSGKTTTLYTLIKTLSSGNRSIITIEDPIEYSIPGVRQIQVNAQKGLTFAAGLRAIVRQDPDIVMVGEIRDTETAYIAVHTALTGHLLLSTMHTIDAATAIPRLMDMKVDPYLIASTVGIVIGQRLVRKRCVCAGTGCAKCDQKGFAGRTGLYEVLSMNNELQNAVAERPSANKIRSIATKCGMRTMESDGIEKVECGITSIEEVLSAIMN